MQDGLSVRRHQQATGLLNVIHNSEVEEEAAELRGQDIRNGGSTLSPDDFRTSGFSRETKSQQQKQQRL